MAKYHINPTTGKAGRCSATIQCKFASSEMHFPSKEAAEKAYEDSMSAHTIAPKARRWEDSKEMLELGFGGLTSPHLASKLMEIDGEYDDDITQGDLQNGGCGDLAYYMEKVYGTEHYCIVDMHSYEATGNIYSLHAVSRLPDGRFVDSRGVWSGDESLLKAWGNEDDEYELMTVDRQVELDPSWDDWEEDYLPTDAKVVDAAKALAIATKLKRV